MKPSMIWYIIMLSTQHFIAVWRVAYGHSRYIVDVVGNAFRTCLSCVSPSCSLPDAAHSECFTD